MMEKTMKETCKTCIHTRPTYKGILCMMSGKKVKTAQPKCEQYGRKVSR